MSDPEQLLRDALQDRAERTSYDATPLADVESGAYRLRRRRRTVGAALTAAAAVVVVVVPLAVVAAQDPETVPAPAPTTTPSVPTPTTTPTTPAPSGGPPQIAYAEGDRIHEPGGRVFQLPRDLGVSGFVAYRGGYLVADARYFEGSVGLTRYDAGGRAVASWTSAGRPVSSADGLVTTWTSFAPPESGTTAPTLVHVASSTGDGPEVTQELDLIQPSVVGMVGVDVVIEGGFGAGGVWATDLVSAPRRIEVLDRATDVSDAQGLIAGSVDQDAIGRVVDAATGEVLWERQGVTVSAFSPDGRYAVATASQGGRREIVEARTGEVLAEVKASGEEHFPTLLELTWEDDGHLLGDLAFNCCAHLGRVDLDGNITPARPRGEIGGTGFVFAATS